MRIAKNVMALILVVLILGVSGLLTYNVSKAQGVIDDYSINEDIHGTRILIATQKKGFKNKVLKNVEGYYSQEDVYIFVTDVTKLNEINPLEWDGLIIFSTIQGNTLHPAVDEFLVEIDDLSRVFMINTADTGEWGGLAMGIDSLTAPSKKGNIEDVGKKIINAINAMR